MIVRFEMPVNVWCDGCGAHIARGVRYNAEKKKCGTYFTSDVFEFQMNCHLCGQRFIIKTDPQNRDYEFVSGLHRKVETFDVKEIGTREFDDKEQALMRADAIRSLENKEEDSMKFEKAVPALDRLKDLEEKLHTNEDMLNQRVRSKLREIRKAEERREARAEAAGLSIRLLPTSRSDIRKSHSVAFERKSKAEVAAKLAEVEARSGDIFGKKDARMERTLKRVIANGVDLKAFKKTETKASEPWIKVIAKPKVKARPKSEASSGGEAKLRAETEGSGESKAALQSGVRPASESEETKRLEVQTEVQTEAKTESEGKEQNRIQTPSEPQSNTQSEPQSSTQSESLSEAKAKNNKPEEKPQSEGPSEPANTSETKTSKGKTKNTLGLVPLTYGEDEE